MKYAIELYFDSRTEKELLALSQKIADAGLSTQFLRWKTRPHLTLACFNDPDEQACIERLKSFARAHEAFPAYLGSVGMFPDTRTIFVSPVMNRGTYRFQAELHDRFKDCDTAGYEWYLPDRWVPHCALALMAEDADELFYKACELTLREFKKIGGEFVAVGLVKITCPVNEIFTARLQK